MDPIFQDFAQKLLTLLLGFLLTVLTAAVGYGVVFIKRKIAEAESKLSSPQVYLLQNMVEIFVKAAEQLGITKQLELTGQEKKQWVIEQLQSYCDDHKIAIDVSVLEAMVEAAILDGVNKGVQTPVYIAPQG